MSPNSQLTGPTTAGGEWITDTDIAGFITRYLQDNGLAGAGDRVDVGPETELVALGLDSLSTAELLLSARAQLVEQGRLDPDVTLLELPLLTTVADLGGLLRTLGPA